MVSQDDLHQFKRFDHYLATKIPDLSRTFLQTLFKEGQIYSESGVKLELKKMPPAGTAVQVNVPPPLPSEAVASPLPLDILYEDEHLLFVNKPAGMVTHPAPGHYDDTLVNAVLYHCGRSDAGSDPMRPGIVHRLDKGTSGVMVVAKNRKAHEGLVLKFSKHDIERIYEALAVGSDLPAGGKLEGAIGRHPQNRLKMTIGGVHPRSATTHFRILKSYRDLQHIELKLETGRTHQIRVHLSQLLRAPILNDHLYGHPSGQLKRLDGRFDDLLTNYGHPLLHAKVLGLEHPVTKEFLRFEVERPRLFSEILTRAREMT